MTEAPRSLTTVARGVAAVLGLACLVSGVPWLLVWVMRLTGGLPSPEELRGALVAGDPTTVVVAALVVMGWLGWAQLVASVVVEGLAWARWDMPGRLPLAGPVQAVVRRLLTSALVLVTLAPAPARANPSPPAVALASQVTVPVPSGVRPPSPDRPSQPGQPATYVVEKRDSLWRIAEEHLGDGRRWREIFDANRGRPQPDVGR